MENHLDMSDTRDTLNTMRLLVAYGGDNQFTAAIDHAAACVAAVKEIEDLRSDYDRGANCRSLMGQVLKIASVAIGDGGRARRITQLRDLQFDR